MINRDVVLAQLNGSIAMAQDPEIFDLIASDQELLDKSSELLVLMVDGARAHIELPDPTGEVGCLHRL